MTRAKLEMQAGTPSHLSLAVMSMWMPSLEESCIPSIPARSTKVNDGP